MSKAIFVTGTGTDVGKTYITGLIVKKLAESGFDAAYYKAAMSGCARGQDGALIPGDAVWVKQTAGIAQPVEQMCPYLYEPAVSPHLAAKLAGNPIRLARVCEQFSAVSRAHELVTVEGSGGILCPLCDEESPLWLEDVVRALRLPSILVADAGLGVINSVGLTAAYMRAHDLPVRGMILNRFQPGDRMQEDNLRMCEKQTGLRVLACVQEGDTELAMDGRALAALFAQTLPIQEEKR